MITIVASSRGSSGHDMGRIDIANSKSGGYNDIALLTNNAKCDGGHDIFNWTKEKNKTESLGTCARNNETVRSATDLCGFFCIY